MFYSRISKAFLVTIVVLVFATTAYAFAAANTLADAGKAGDGSNTVSGYTVDGVTYNLDATDPSLVASVEFDLDDTASDVAASISDGTTETFGACTNAGTHWTCTFTGVTALDAASFRVIAAQ